MNITMLISEFFQLRILGINYFSQLDNLIDLIGIVFIFLQSNYEPGNYDSFHEAAKILINIQREENGKEFLSIGFFFILTNLILQLATMFKRFRTFWIIIDNSIIATLQYMVLPFAFMLTFALCKSINQNDAGSFEAKFAKILAEEYQ